MKTSARVERVRPPPVDSANRRRLELEQRGQPITNLGQAIPWFGPPTAATARLSAELADPEIHRYTADAGNEALRCAIAAHAGHAVDSQQILVTAGANHGFHIVCAALFDESDRVGLLSPYFVNHSMALSGLGVVPVEILPDEQFCYDAEKLEQIIAHQGLQGLVLVNPSNPTGKIFSRRELEDVVDVCRRRGVWLIVDEVYRSFTPENANSVLIHEIPAARDISISLWSFSKEYGMTGWRIGALRAPKELMEKLLKVQDYSIICAPHAAQVTVLHCLRHYPQYARQFRREFEARRTTVSAILTNAKVLQVYEGPGAFFLWFRPTEGPTNPDIYLRLMEEAGVCVMPGSAFGLHYSGWLRLSYGLVGGKELADAAARITDFFQRSTTAGPDNHCAG